MEECVVFGRKFLCEAGGYAGCDAPVVFDEPLEGGREGCCGRREDE